MLEQLPKIQTLMREAGAKILEVYRSGDFQAETKSDDSPVTVADLAANRILVEGLKKLSSVAIVSEESVESQQLAKADRARFWLVDPLDGTRDFVAKKDTFVVCVALVEENAPVLGLLYAPALDVMYWAAKGSGAFCLGPDTQQGAKKIFNSSSRQALIAAASRSHASPRVDAFLKKFNIQKLERVGSALKFGWLAEGKIDLYPRFGNTSEWDTAAGQIIAEEAGCKVIDIASGARLIYNKPAFLNGGFIASRPDLDIVGQLEPRS